MIAITYRWKIVEHIGLEAEYGIFTLSLGYERNYQRRARRALWQLQKGIPGPLGTFPILYHKPVDDRRVKASTADTLVRCGRCGNKPTPQNQQQPQGVVVIQQQTRSADEGMTNFYTCLDCGNKWKG